MFGVRDQDHVSAVDLGDLWKVTPCWQVSRGLWCLKYYGWHTSNGHSCEDSSTVILEIIHAHISPVRNQNWLSVISVSSQEICDPSSKSQWLRFCTYVMQTAINLYSGVIQVMQRAVHVNVELRYACKMSFWSFRCCTGFKQNWKICLGLSCVLDPSLAVSGVLCDAQVFLNLRIIQLFWQIRSLPLCKISHLFFCSWLSSVVK